MDGVILGWQWADTSVSLVCLPRSRGWEGCQHPSVKVFFEVLPKFSPDAAYLESCANGKKTTVSTPLCCTIGLPPGPLLFLPTPETHPPFWSSWELVWACCSLFSRAFFVVENPSFKLVVVATSSPKVWLVFVLAECQLGILHSVEFSMSCNAASLVPFWMIEYTLTTYHFYTHYFHK